MRLIDADALKQAMNYNGGCGICFLYIDDAETIDAIPVCWLEAKRENLFFDALVNGKVYGNTSIDDIHCINRVLEICGKKGGENDG